MTDRAAVLAALDRLLRAMPRNTDLILVAEDYRAAIAAESNISNEPSNTVSNTAAPTPAQSNKSNGFDKRVYQRDYMRRRRARA